MLIKLKHRVRQLYYRYWPFRGNSHYKLFAELYQRDPSYFSWIKPHPSGNGFFTATFKRPDHAKYQGREVVHFTSTQLAVFWLPGAEHSAQGYVETGTYNCQLDKFSVKKPVTLCVNKNEYSTEITSIDCNDKEPNTTRDAVVLDGGFVTYDAIEQELIYLISQYYVTQGES